MRLILIRHSQSRANVEGKVSSTPPGSDITDQGVAQAEQLGADLTKLYTIHQLFSSPMLRTYHTAQVLNRHFHTQHIISDARLSEMYFGEYDGRSSGLMFDDWQRFIIKVGQHDYSARIGQLGESEFAFRDRLLSFLIETAARYQPDQVVAAVTHQAPAKLLQQMIEPEVEAVLLGNAEYIVMQLSANHVAGLVDTRQQILNEFLQHTQHQSGSLE